MSEIRKSLREMSNAELDQEIVRREVKVQSMREALVRAINERNRRTQTARGGLTLIEGEKK